PSPTIAPSASSTADRCPSPRRFRNGCGTNPTPPSASVPSSMLWWRSSTSPARQRQRRPTRPHPSERERALSDHSTRFMQQAGQVALGLDTACIERIAGGLVALRERGGRLFLLGVGGSAANCSHAVNDFRKLCGIEA